MKATKIYYQKCFNLGNYQNEVVGIELEVGDGEKAIDVLEKAKQFVDSKDFLAAGIQEYEIPADNHFIHAFEEFYRIIFSAEKDKCYNLILEQSEILNEIERISKLA